jgi:hypothetical protein
MSPMAPHKMLGKVKTKKAAFVYSNAASIKMLKN